MEHKDNHPQITALLQGDENTIRVIYNSVFPKVKKFTLNNNGTASDAEEVFQEALYQLIVRAKLKGVTIKSSFDGYLLTICKNLWYKELNKRNKEVRNEGVFELKEKEDDRIASILQQDRWDLFEEMMTKLSENCMNLLKDYFNKVPYSTIVEKFSYATENAAFQRVFKCKEKLMKLIKTDPRYKNL
jgi:RNA polymerase sigma factor (sigma-70 family)